MPSGRKERADVFANTVDDLDREAAVTRHVEGGARFDGEGVRGAVQDDLAGTGDDFHTLGSGGAEVGRGDGPPVRTAPAAAEGRGSGVGARAREIPPPHTGAEAVPHSKAFDIFSITDN